MSLTLHEAWTYVLTIVAGGAAIVGLILQAFALARARLEYSKLKLEAQRLALDADQRKAMDEKLSLEIEKLRRELERGERPTLILTNTERGTVVESKRTAELDYHALITPAVWRSPSAVTTELIRALAGPDDESIVKYDVPAFLRRQAD